MVNASFWLLRITPIPLSNTPLHEQGFEAHPDNLSDMSNSVPQVIHAIRALIIFEISDGDIRFYWELGAPVETSPLFCSVERPRKTLARTFHRTD